MEEIYDDLSSNFIIGVVLMAVSLILRIHVPAAKTGAYDKNFQSLSRILQKEDLRTFIIQSVESPEMTMWCSKNYFKPVPATAFESNGIIYGDYSLILS